MNVLDTTFTTGRGKVDTDSDALITACASLRLAITYLYKIPLRLPVPMARVKDLPEEDDGSTRFYEVLDRNHVREAFPNMDQRLAMRLAATITQRRRLLRYRESRSQKLKVNSHLSSIEDNMSVTATTLRPAPDDSPATIDATPSEPGTISTIASSLPSESLHLPKRPISNTGQTLEDFECPCCFRAVHVGTGDRAWK
jgi:hypothetical protein